MESNRPLSCLWCEERRFLRIRSGAPVLFSLRLRARKLCVRPASSRIMFIIMGLGLRCEPLAQRRRKKF